jgi:hypothetical protein
MKEQQVDEPRLVRVFVAQGMLPAQVVKGRLEAAGIPVLLKYESVGLIFGLTFDGLGSVDVLVPEQFSGDAVSLLSEDVSSGDEAA